MYNNTKIQYLQKILNKLFYANIHRKVKSIVDIYVVIHQVNQLVTFT